MGLDDAVEKSTADETKFTIDRGSSSASVCPGVCVVVRESGISVLEVGDGNCFILAWGNTERYGRTYRASGGPRNTE
jgi:hypothetical protein